MAKKKPKKKPAPSDSYIRWLVSTPPELKDWCERQAANQGISRDAFLRLLIRTAAAAWEESDPAESALFDDLSTHLEQTVERAVSRAIQQQPINVVEARLRGKRGRA